MCEKAVEKDPYQLGDFPDCLKTQEMCGKAVEDEPEILEYVPDHLKTKEICKEAVHRGPYALGYVPDHFNTQKCVKKQLKKIHDHWKLSLTILKIKRCATRPFKQVHIS